jgi:hypothetical protein
LICLDARSQLGNSRGPRVSAAHHLASRLLFASRFGTVVNALVTGIRRGLWSGVHADAAFVLLRQLPIDLADEPADLDRPWELSRRFDDTRSGLCRAGGATE